MNNLLVLLFSLITVFGYSQNYIINRNNPGSNEWVIVWGGKPSESYGARYMQKEVSKHLNCVNVIWADYQLSRQKCDQLINSVSSGGVVKDVYGFSRGGLNAFMEIGSVNNVWLIDPLLPQNYDISLGKSSVFMIYNPQVWDSGNRHRLVEFSKKLISQNCIKVSISHLSIPEYFFNTYR